MGFQVNHPLVCFRSVTTKTKIHFGNRPTYVILYMELLLRLVIPYTAFHWCNGQLNTTIQYNYGSSKPKEESNFLCSVSESVHLGNQIVFNTKKSPKFS